MLVNTEMPQQMVAALLRGPPKSHVVLHLGTQFARFTSTKKHKY
jgi:hypothetical protein